MLSFITKLRVYLLSYKLSLSLISITAHRRSISCVRVRFHNKCTGVISQADGVDNIFHMRKVSVTSFRPSARSYLTKGIPNAKSDQSFLQ